MNAADNSPGSTASALGTPPGPRPPSLRGDFAWTLSGNAVYAAGQWAILSLFAKLGGTEVLGQYALALAVIAPLGMLAHLNLRSVLATDVARRFAFGDYLAVRLAVSAAAMAGFAVLAVMAGGDRNVAAAILLAGLAQSSETVSDLCYGAMQRRDRMRLVAASMIARTMLAVTALGVVLWITKELVWAMVALAAGRLLVLAVFDLPLGRREESIALSGAAASWKIFLTALPLGLILMLISLNANLPRYAIEQRLGSVELGVFTAVVSFITVGSTMVNALGQSATARLARCFQEGQLREFRRLTLRISAFVLGLGLAGIAVAVVAGELVLRWLYRPEFAAHQPLLVAAMAAGMLGYLAIALGYAVTSARLFHAQLPLFAIAAAGCGAASWVLVPRFGLFGGVFALALASLLQVGGQLWILRGALRRREQAP